MNAVPTEDPTVLKATVRARYGEAAARVVVQCPENLTAATAGREQVVLSVVRERLIGSVRVCDLHEITRWRVRVFDDPGRSCDGGDAILGVAREVQRDAR